MESDNETARTFRNALGGVLLVGILWQIQVVFFVFGITDSMRALFSGLGAELPPVTTIFFTVYRGSVVLPVLSAALVFDLFRRPGLAPAYTVFVSLFVYGCGFGLQAITIQVLYQPMFALMGKIH